MCKKSKCKTCGFTECEEHPGTITLTPEDVDRLATEKSVKAFYGWEEYLKDAAGEWYLDHILIPVKELNISIAVKTTGEVQVIGWARQAKELREIWLRCPDPDCKGSYPHFSVTQDDIDESEGEIWCEYCEKVCVTATSPAYTRKDKTP